MDFYAVYRELKVLDLHSHLRKFRGLRVERDNVSWCVLDGPSCRNNKQEASLNLFINKVHNFIKILQL